MWSKRAAGKKRKALSFLIMRRHTLQPVQCIFFALANGAIAPENRSFKHCSPEALLKPREDLEKLWGRLLSKRLNAQFVCVHVTRGRASIKVLQELAQAKSIFYSSFFRYMDALFKCSGYYLIKKPLSLLYVIPRRPLHHNRSGNPLATGEEWKNTAEFLTRTNE